LAAKAGETQDGVPLLDNLRKWGGCPPARTCGHHVAPL